MKIRNENKRIMSKKKELIEVAPPQRIGAEKLVTRAHRCPYCSGRGWHMDEGPHGVERKQCPDCKGAGMIRAIVTINWLPAAMAAEAQADGESLAQVMEAARDKVMLFKGKL